MSKRFLDGIFAIGLVAGGFFAIFSIVWVIGLNYCPNSPCQSEINDQHSPNLYENQFSTTIGPNTTAGVHPADTEGHESYYERLDLRAQEEMANWAKEMALAAIAGAIFTFLGLVLIFRTLHHTKRAANYTKDMLKEAKETTTAATEGAKASVDAVKVAIGEQRPWLGLEVIPTSEFNYSEDSIGVGLDIRIKNKGKAPAFIFNYRVNFYDGMNYDNNRARFYIETQIDGAVKHPSFSRVIFPEEEDTLPMTFDGERSPLTPKFIMEGGVQVALGITVFYRTSVSDEVHYTHRTYQVLGPKPFRIYDGDTYAAGKFNLSSYNYAMIAK